MKKLSIFLTVFLLIIILGAPSWAIDQTKKFAIGGYAGYGFGFGDFFKDQEFGYYDPDLGFVGYSFKNKLTFCFGAKAKYGLTPELALVGALDYQSGDVDVKAAAGGFAVGVSESYHWTGILANILYTLSPDKKTCPYLTGGVGYYMPEEGDSKPGINLGGGIEHFFQPNLALDAGARFHMIFTEDKNTTYIQILAGLNYYFGTK